jgi:N-methylhydantoinase A
VLLPAEELLKESQQLKNILKRLEEEGLQVLRAEAFSHDRMRFEHSLDMRYLGQAYDLNVPLGSIGTDVIAAFHRTHEMRYGYQHKNRQVEIVNVRCRATGITEKPPVQKMAPRSRTKPLLPEQTMELGFYDSKRKTALYRRDNLRAGDIFSGPAIVAEYSATTLVPPGWRARVDDYGQLLLTPK